MSTGAEIQRDSAEHRRYMRSKQWRALRDTAIMRAGYRCCVCGRVHMDTRKLQVHHKTYDRLGKERAEDLMVMCRRCHRRVSTW